VVPRVTVAQPFIVNIKTHKHGKPSKKCIEAPYGRGATPPIQVIAQR
jgi:hypothetical protein